MNPLTSIQISRAVAAWLVVFSHYMQLFPTSHLVKEGWDKYGWLGYFGVDLFFVISGFIMFYSLANRMYSAKEFFVRRLIRIVPAYWFVTFLMALLVLPYAAEFSYTDWNWNSLLASLFFIVHDNPSGIGYYPLLTVGWTLGYEMFFYALLSLCILTCGRFYFHACTLILIALPLLWKEQWLFGAMVSQKLLYAFACGIALGYAYVRLKNSSPRLLYTLGPTLFALAATLFIIGQPFEDPVQIGGNEERPLLAFLLIGSALCFESALSNIRYKAFELLKYLGDISYSTYLLHTLAIGVFFHYLGKLDNAPEELLLLLAASLTIILMSHLSYRYVETVRLPAIIKKIIL